MATTLSGHYKSLLIEKNYLHIWFLACSNFSIENHLPFTTPILELHKPAHKTTFLLFQGLRINVNVLVLEIRGKLRNHNLRKNGKIN